MYWTPSRIVLTETSSLVSIKRLSSIKSSTSSTDNNTAVCQWTFATKCRHIFAIAKHSFVLAQNRSLFEIRKCSQSVSFVPGHCLLHLSLALCFTEMWRAYFLSPEHETTQTHTWEKPLCEWEGVRVSLFHVLSSTHEYMWVAWISI